MNEIDEIYYPPNEIYEIKEHIAAIQHILSNVTDKANHLHKAGNTAELVCKNKEGEDISRNVHSYLVFMTIVNEDFDEFFKIIERRHLPILKKIIETYEEVYAVFKKRIKRKS